MAATPVREAPWTAEGQAKRTVVQDLFSQIAPKYDRLNGIMSLSRHHRWRMQAVRAIQVQPGETALDVCCGTGDFMAPLKKAVGASGNVFGLDFCMPMLEVAKAKGIPSLAAGDACALPVQSASVDVVTVGWGIRNVPDIDAAHREIARVLRPGGRFVSIDMAIPRNGLVRALSGFVSRRILPILGSLFGHKTAYTYLPKSTERFLSREELVASMERAGFGDVKTRDLMMGNVCMHWGTKR